MGSLISQLDNDSILLLYLAGELPDEEKAEVDRRLASDPSLAQSLARLADAQRAMDTALKAGDAVVALPISRDVAVRRVGRAMQQWQIDRHKPASAPFERRPFRLPWWAYPAAGVAAVVGGILLWSSNIDDVDNSPECAERLAMESSDEQQQLADTLVASFNLGQDDHLQLSMSDQDDVNSIFLRSKVDR